MKENLIIPNPKGYTDKKEPCFDDSFIEKASDKYVEGSFKSLGADKETLPTDANISKQDFINGARWYRDFILNNYPISELEITENGVEQISDNVDSLRRLFDAGVFYIGLRFKLVAIRDEN